MFYGIAEAVRTGSSLVERAFDVDGVTLYRLSIKTHPGIYYAIFDTETGRPVTVLLPEYVRDYRACRRSRMRNFNRSKTQQV